MKPKFKQSKTKNKKKTKQKENKTKYKQVEVAFNSFKILNQNINSVESVLVKSTLIKLPLIQSK